MKKENILYIILDGELLAKTKRNLLATAKKILNAKPDFIQLRLKSASTKDALAQSLRLAKLVKGHPATRLLINDRVDIAKAAGADGVHLGSEDLPVSLARKLLGRGAIIGKTAHSLKEMKQALKEPLDYISVGPVFKTPLKPGLKALGAEKTKILTQTEKKQNIPVVAIGGITLTNVTALTRQGVRNIAVTRSVTLSKDPLKTIKQFQRLLAH